MVFEIEERVALITGGASGIGLEYAKELLRNGARAVTLADLNSKFGENALEEIEDEFGSNKAIFVQTDVTNKQQYEDAFQKTIDTFHNIDIVINNAGIMDESIWEKEIAVNVNGVVHGMLLGINTYLPKYKTGAEAVIVNISSTAATINGCGHIPVYTATKHATLGLTMSWGFPEFYEHNKVRVIAVCPGITNTPMVDRMPYTNWGGIHKEWLDRRQDKFVIQEPGFVAKEVMKVIRHAGNGTIWIIDSGQTAYQFIMPFMTTMQNNVIC